MSVAKRFVVAQTPKTAVWRHYLCGWCSPGDSPPSGWHATHSDVYNVPCWASDREQALMFDETTARQLVDQFDARYRRVVCHHIEELS